MLNAEIPKNMHIFNVVALNVFDELYEAFPKPIDIDAKKIGSKAVARGGMESGTSPDSIAENTLIWLATEGLIRYKAGPSNPGSEFNGVQLTLRGLRILDNVPAEIVFGEEPETMIVMMRKALDSASAEAIKSILKVTFTL